MPRGQHPESKVREPETKTPNPCSVHVAQYMPLALPGRANNSLAILLPPRIGVHGEPECGFLAQQRSHQVGLLTTARAVRVLGTLHVKTDSIPGRYPP